jgi:hypothetical protein
MKRCNDCNTLIPKERLSVVPDTEHCIDCVDNHTKPKRGLMDYSHKTAGEVVFVDGKHNWNRANAVYRRQR